MDAQQQLPEAEKQPAPQPDGKNQPAPQPEGNNQPAPQPDDKKRKKKALVSELLTTLAVLAVIGVVCLVGYILFLSLFFRGSLLEVAKSVFSDIFH